METEQQLVRSWITEGIILALIPGSAYLWALYHQRGFCNYFYIPNEFIALSLTEVLASSGPAFLMLSTGIILVIVVRFLLSILPIATSGFVLSMSGIFHLIHHMRDPVERDPILVIIGTCFIMLGLFLLFVPPLTREHDQGNYWRRLWAHINPSAASQSPESLQPIYQVISRQRALIEIIVLLILVWGFTLFSAYSGNKYARTRSVFPVVNQSTEMVVLRIYGDYLVSAPFDRSTREFQKNLYLLKISEMDKTPLTLEKVGPLVRPQVKP